MSDHQKAQSPQQAPDRTPAPQEKRPQAEQGQQPDEQLGVEKLEERIAPRVRA